MHRCPICQDKLSKTVSGNSFWTCNGHGVAVSMALLHQHLPKSSLGVISSYTDYTLEKPLCTSCSAPMQFANISFQGFSNSVAVCYKCRFYWLDEATAKAIAPKQRPNDVINQKKDLALATVAFEHKMVNEEMRYEQSIIQRLLQFILLFPISAKKAFVKPILRAILFLIRRG